MVCCSNIMGGCRNNEVSDTWRVVVMGCRNNEVSDT